LTFESVLGLAEMAVIFDLFPSFPTTSVNLNRNLCSKFEKFYGSFDPPEVTFVNEKSLIGQ
jgi:hypothetical protein